jgi:predicted nucleic-acid-binding Zn-ribbon protein
MHEIDNTAQAMRSCGHCGGTAFYWRTAIVAGDPRAPRGSAGARVHHQPAWSCMNCGSIEPHERRIHAEPAWTEERRHV